jgi:FtsP/CotA-like multicopper oxidase with cupredoxin domain
MKKLYQVLLPVFVCLAPLAANAQSFRVQCPTSTITHPAVNPNSPTKDNNSEPSYTAATTLQLGTNGYLVPSANVNGAIKCQQISGGDGYATMGDGTQTYMFSFGPLSGITDIANGLPGTEFPKVFNQLYSEAKPLAPPLQPGDPATTDGAGPGPNPVSSFGFNGAVGLAPDMPNLVTITDIVEGIPPLAENPTPPPAFLPAGTDYCSRTPGTPGYPGPNVVTVYMDAPLGLIAGQQVVIQNDAATFGETGSNTPAGYLGTWTITCVNNNGKNPDGLNSYIITYNDPIANLAANTGTFNAGTASSGSAIDGHVDPRPIMDVGVMNGNIPAPLFAIDEDDEFFLTLTNVGMIMRPDLFEQHTVHFHGYPNASTLFDGVPDASVAINIGASFTYYYLAPDAGTYFWHCHITPPEHLQMGMVGQLYVRPRQNRVPSATSLFTALQNQQSDPRTACRRPGDTLPAVTSFPDILCSNPVPAVNSAASQGTDKLGNPQQYAYNDGDGSTRYDVEYPLQMHGFDPNFHFVGMTFNPEGFADMKDKYFLLNGRSYPDTVQSGPLATTSADGAMHYSQPMAAIINIPQGGRALLRISSLDVSEYQTLASLGIPMTVVGYNAKLLRDQEGNNLYYSTNSITLGGGESLDVILDASNTTLYPSGSVFYLYTSNLDHLSNDAENFGGLMTEVRIK